MSEKRGRKFISDEQKSVLWQALLDHGYLCVLPSPGHRRNLHFQAQDN